MRAIRLIVSDVDGVWTDGGILLTGDGEIKRFHVRDGLAVKIAQRAGLPVVVITSRTSKSLERRCRELGIEDLVQGAGSKVAEVSAAARRHHCAIEEVFYIGDDLPDLAPIRSVGLSAAPADAAQEVRDSVDWILDANGGAGAFREAVEKLLRSRGEWDRVVEGFREAQITAPGV